MTRSRTLFEKSDRAAAVACYGDGAQDLESSGARRSEGRARSRSLPTRARRSSRASARTARCRAAKSRSSLSLRKGKPQIDVADVEAVVGDVSELALERVYFAAASGEGTRAIAECGRAVSSGESPQAIIAATQRHFQRLHRVRAGDGARTERSTRRCARCARRCISSRRMRSRASAGRGRSERLAEATQRIAAAAKAARLSSPLEEALTERLLLGLAMLARAQSRCEPAPLARQAADVTSDCTAHNAPIIGRPRCGRGVERGENP